MRSADTLSIQKLSFSWAKNAPALLTIDDLKLGSGSSLFLRGPSGCGKSTLLNLAAGVLEGYKGSIEICGQRLESLSARQRDRLRADHIGLIFQQFNLLPWLTPLENVALACRFSDRRRTRAVERSGSVIEDARRLMSELGLDEVLSHNRPTSALSIGQQQRVAAARALIGGPELIMADEPTSALDTEHRDRFIDLLLAEARECGTSLLFVSHDLSLAQHFEHTLHLEGARIAS
ncbi:Methionine ABC transporter ATP-binding protein [Marinobacterium lacunae]|uniref:Methionine ABC transporter ATP-binding protein n=1 Tax=Marinobacterium lacunae TaxID=1232683 RepID=A0A081FXX6_9GAMM|nr:ABC transporter ATP-binding protein [Marinobacterium lacunae]KEA63381.1 Methionine ABC transporter ATP-binding protein [Marinobacterium lacunae]